MNLIIFLLIGALAGWLAGVVMKGRGFGVLVNIVTHNDPTGGGEASWNLRNRNNQFVASGVYFYHVETPDGREKIGRFTVVNYAQ